MKSRFESADRVVSEYSEYKDDENNGIPKIGNQATRTPGTAAEYGYSGPLCTTAKIYTIAKSTSKGCAELAGLILSDDMSFGQKVSWVINHIKLSLAGSSLADCVEIKKENENEYDNDSLKDDNVVIRITLINKSDDNRQEIKRTLEALDYKTEPTGKQCDDNYAISKTTVNSIVTRYLERQNTIIRCMEEHNEVLSRFTDT